MQVKSIAGSILQYFWPSLSHQLSLRPLFCLLLSGHFTQVLLYIEILYLLAISVAEQARLIFTLCLPLKTGLFYDQAHILGIMCKMVSFRMWHHRDKNYLYFSPSKHMLWILLWTVKVLLHYPKCVLTYAGPQIRVHNRKLFFLFLKQNICCGYPKEPSRWDGSFEHPKYEFKLMGKKMLNWPYVMDKKLIKT